MKHELIPLPPGIAVVDSHCHLADAAFDGDRDEVWERARAAGVAAAIVIGAGGGSASNPAAIECVRSRPEERFRAVVGIHPHDARDADAGALAEIERLAADPLVVAVGETASTTTTTTHLARRRSNRSAPTSSSRLASASRW